MSDAGRDRGGGHRRTGRGGRRVGKTGVGVEDGGRAGVLDPDPEVLGARGGAAAVPVINVAGRVAPQQLPRARSLPAGPELIARVGAAGGGGGERDLSPRGLRRCWRRGFGHRPASGAGERVGNAGQAVVRGGGGRVTDMHSYVVGAGRGGRSPVEG